MKKNGETFNYYSAIVALPRHLGRQIGTVASAMGIRKSQVEGPCSSSNRGSTVCHDTPRDHSRPRGRIGQ
jgi:hypothetical protein